MVGLLTPALLQMSHQNHLIKHKKLFAKIAPTKDLEYPEQQGKNQSKVHSKCK